LYIWCLSAKIHFFDDKNKEKSHFFDDKIGQKSHFFEVKADFRLKYVLQTIGYFVEDVGRFGRNNWRYFFVTAIISIFAAAKLDFYTTVLKI
jgi:hypothetical protein